MIRFLLLLVVLALVGLGGLPLSLGAAEHTKDTLDVVKKTISEKKAILLDVREKSEWDDGHVKGARFLPLSTLQAMGKAKEVAQVVPKGKIVYCHCGSGIRCLKAADVLQKLGYDVRPLKSGYKDLVKAGFAPVPR